MTRSSLCTKLLQCPSSEAPQFPLHAQGPALLLTPHWSLLRVSNLKTTQNWGDFLRVFISKVIKTTWKSDLAPLRAPVAESRFYWSDTSQNGVRLWGDKWTSKSSSESQINLGFGKSHLPPLERWILQGRGIQNWLKQGWGVREKILPQSSAGRNSRPTQGRDVVFRWQLLPLVPFFWHLFCHLLAFMGPLLVPFSSWFIFIEFIEFLSSILSYIYNILYHFNIMLYVSPSTGFLFLPPFFPAKHKFNDKFIPFIPWFQGTGRRKGNWFHH